MTRTTPPRPLDVTGLFPELRAHSATATRLHPRPGAPTSADSSVGGPLLWPADEEWPVCNDGDAHYVFQLRTPATVHRDRKICAAAQARAHATGDRYALTDDERAQLSDPDFSEQPALVEHPVPLVAVAQVYRRDVADFVGPDGADVLQVLWCPLDHPDVDYNPRVRLYWRRSTDVTQPLTVAPQPPVVNENYLPTPCVVHPEQVLEYQYGGLLPADLDAQITEWEEQVATSDDEGAGINYGSDLSLAPGWKVAGFANWLLTDPHPMTCRECGAAMTLLFTAASGEWDGVASSWRPLEEPAQAPCNPTGVHIGRGYALYIFGCPVSFDHPVATTMQ